MSKKLIDAQSEAGDLPFFAHLLSNQSDPATGSGPKPAPTYHCLDSECTKKYPSDDDEPTSTLWDK
ncbi:MAG: microviridin/marinostatin family tricyclic proteinase inhibitor [Nannocystis sp.]|nr:microviridin/marinostatin family tricyclic proteinase inhibitor [Nannocystis sp.]MBA3549913.1 microviridin/marinostatin family tricyclic proteinase inhibitor [Nannocystis sp.]